MFLNWYCDMKTKNLLLKLLTTICFVFLVLAGSSCSLSMSNSKDTNLSSHDNSTLDSSDINAENSEYSYEVSASGVKLLKYNGEYKTLIDIPEEIDGKKVVSIAKGCFVKEKNTIKSIKKTKSSDEVDNETSDISTYAIDDNVETIEDGAFDENSTFLTDNITKPEGWKESSMQGSGKEGTGNVYYDTQDQDTIVSKGIVYLKNRLIGGLIVARCLTQSKEVEIPDLVDGEKVIDIGNGAFSYNNNIEKVTLPYTIGEVFKNAFSYCTNLKEVIFESENLSRLMMNSFKGCESLEIIKLPKNCTYLASYAFADCGNIDKIYMPFSMTNIKEYAFSNTTISEIIYSGTQEQFGKIKMGTDVVELFSQTKIIYATEQNKVVLSSLNEINNYDDNTFVEFEGIVTGYYNQKGVYVTDPIDGYSILCFNSNNLPYYDVEYVGRKVKVSGDKIHYIGQLEVAHAEIELIGEEKYEITLIELDLTDKNLNINDYLGYYVVVKGKVTEIFNKFTYLEGCNTYLFAYYRWPESLTVMVGDTIEVVGWVHVYNQNYEIMYDTRLIKIIEQ